MVIEVVNWGGVWGGVGELWILHTDDAREAAEYALLLTVGREPVVTYAIQEWSTFRRVLNPPRKYTVAHWRGGRADISVKGVGLIQHAPSLLKLAPLGAIVEEPFGE